MVRKTHFGAAPTWPGLRGLAAWWKPRTDNWAANQNDERKEWKVPLVLRIDA